MPKQGKKAFVTQKTNFVKMKGKYCDKCKNVGHVQNECTKKKAISFDANYILKKNFNVLNMLGYPLVV